MLTLKKLLKDADERVRQAAADAINEAAKQLEQDIHNTMAENGIQSRSGKLYGSVKANKATPKKPSVVIKSEVYKNVPRRPGSRNPAMRGRYKKGVPYGRILEFSPRFKKYNGFFYKVWYKNRKRIKEDVILAIGKAWSES